MKEKGILRYIKWWGVKKCPYKGYTFTKKAGKWTAKWGNHLTFSEKDLDTLKGKFDDLISDQRRARFNDCRGDHGRYSRGSSINHYGE